MSRKPEAGQINRDELLAVLRESLSLDVKTDSSYTGGMDGGSLYRDVHTLQLLFDGEVISEVTI